MAEPDSLNRPQVFNGRFADLLTDATFRKGKLIHFYPPDPVDVLKAGLPDFS
jgi:hypothetical protein